MTPFSNNAQRLFQNSMLGAEILLCLGRIFKDMCTHCNLSSRLISRLNILMHMNHRSRQLKASSTCVHNTIVAYNFTPWHMQLSHISTILTNNLLANVTMCSKTLVTKSSTSQWTIYHDCKTFCNIRDRMLVAWKDFILGWNFSKFNNLDWTSPFNQLVRRRAIAPFMAAESLGVSQNKIILRCEKTFCANNSNYNGLV